jgi:Cu+-exporting ATPase
MTVDTERAAGSVEYEGTTYYFCSNGCRTSFMADPKKYLG